MIDLAPIWQPDTQQRNYRALLEAMSRPGRVQPLMGLGDGQQAVLAALATLLDGTVTCCDPDGLLQDADWPLLQAAPTVAEQADFIVCDGRHITSFQPKLGVLPSPERSATLLLRVDSLGVGDRHWRLSGPGVGGENECRLGGLHEDWPSLREDWVCGFPLGVDILLLDDCQVMGLPRSTRLEVL